MLKPEQIPDEVVEAALAMRDRGGSMQDIIRTAINAWPGMAQKTTAVGLDVKRGKVVMDPHIILPLLKEPEA